MDARLASVMFSRDLAMKVEVVIGARSKLILEETRKAKEATSDAQAACTTLLTTTNFDETKSTNHGSGNGSHGHENSRHRRGNAGHGNNGRGRGNHGRGRVLPTHIKNAMHTMTLNTPEENQYIDTGATSHMASNQGIFSSYFNIPHRKDVIVGSGHSLPFCSYRHASLSSSNPPLRLQTVLHVPNLIKHLIFVRRFTTDNFVTIAFEPFGFDVKDYMMGTPILSCNSTRDLYPLLHSMLQQASSPSDFTVLSLNLYHYRLGHPGAATLRSLRNNKFIL
ncbi:hypothetical protein Tco_0849610 [Tanacetum coccineum]